MRKVGRVWGGSFPDSAAYPLHCCPRRPFGQIREARIITDRETGRSKGASNLLLCTAEQADGCAPEALDEHICVAGYGFVTLGSGPEAQAAIRSLDGMQVGERKIAVRVAGQKGGPPPRPGGPPPTMAPQAAYHPYPATPPMGAPGAPPYWNNGMAPPQPGYGMPPAPYAYGTPPPYGAYGAPPYGAQPPGAPPPGYAPGYPPGAPSPYGYGYMPPPGYGAPPQPGQPPAEAQASAPAPAAWQPPLPSETTAAAAPAAPEGKVLSEYERFMQEMNA